MIFEVSAEAKRSGYKLASAQRFDGEIQHVRPAVIIFCPGRAGPTGPTCADNAGGSSRTSLYSSCILTESRIRALKIMRDWSATQWTFQMNHGRSHIFSSSLSPKSVPLNKAAVRLTLVRSKGASGGKPPKSIPFIAVAVVAIVGWCGGRS